MPWAKNTYTRTEMVYKELLKDVALEGRNDFDQMIKEILIKVEIMKRDFTKRQLNILQLICNFSIAYGKESALLKTTDFSLCGVPVKKINSEISKLIEYKVISWDKDFNEFSINEPRFWEVPYHDHYNDNRSRELFILNLKHAGIEVAPIIEKLNKLKL